MYDFNNDGWKDLFTANAHANHRIDLWESTDYRQANTILANMKDGTFEDATEKSIGIDTRKGMNVDVADYDNDGWLDIYVTNITDEYMKECNMLWHNNHDGTFTDVSKETNTCATLWGWSAKFGDFDNDGWADLFVVNGLRSASKENYIPVLLEMMIKPGIDFTDVRLWPNIGNMTWSGYQKKKMFQNLAGQTFKEVSAEAGVDNDFDGRGIGMADFDNDGRLDLYQVNADQFALLYKGQTDGGHWVQLQLTGTGRSNRDAIGARIKLSAGGVTQIKEIDGGNGYAGQSSKRAHFGIGKAAKVDSIEIRWPDGTVEKPAAPTADKLTRIKQGGARAK